MSKFVDEIIADIKAHPETWMRFGDNGMYKNNVYLDNFGNGHKFYFFWYTSIIECNINGKDTGHLLTFKDKYRLEETFKWWTKTVSLKIMLT